MLALVGVGVQEMLSTRQVMLKGGPMRPHLARIVLRCHGYFAFQNIFGPHKKVLVGGVPAPLKNMSQLR